MKKKIICAYLIMSTLNVLGQNWIKKIEDSYLSYYKYAEEQFVFAFNKSAYYPGEEAWFSCYVLENKTKKIFDKTKKGNLLIYNNKGHLIESKFLEFIEGVASSYIKIPKRYIEDKLFYRIETLWSKNFNPSAISELTVVSKKASYKEVVSKQEVDIVPESGKLVDGVLSVIWVRLNKKYNKILEGYIEDEEANKVSYFKINKLGRGKLYFKPDSKKKYKLIIKEIGSFSMPPIEKNGIVFNLVEKEDTYFLSLRGNFKDEEKGNFTYMIHQNGEIFYSGKLNLEKNKKTLWVEKKSLKNGVYTVSLFNKDRLEGERSFYNDKENNKCTVTITGKRVKKDSVKFNLYKHCLDSILNISVSVLPLENQLYTKEKIKSKIYFSQFKDSFIDNEAFVFDKIKVYNWDKILNTKKKNIKFFFEYGFTLKGKLKNYKNNKLLKNFPFGFYLKEGNVYSSETDSLGSFIINGLNITKGDTIKFLSYDSKINKVKASLNQADIIDSFIKVPKLIYSYNKNIITNIFFDTGNEVLDEVIVQGKREVINNRKNDGVVNPVDNTTFTEGLEITSDNVNNYKSVIDYLDSQSGIKVNNDQGYVKIFSLRAKQSTITQGGEAKSGSEKPMNVYINNNMIREDEMAYLNFIPLNEVRRISINKSGIGRGGTDPFGAIVIYLNDKFILSKNRTINKKEKIKKSNFYIFDFGYEKKTNYRTPYYIFSEKDSEYKKHAVLYWMPRIVFKGEKVSNHFITKIPETIKNIRISIQGITKNGETIDIKKKMVIE